MEVRRRGLQPWWDPSWDAQLLKLSRALWGLLGIKAFLCPLAWVPKNWFNQLLIREGRGCRDEQGTVKKKHAALGQGYGSTSRDIPNIFGLLCGTKISTKWKMVTTWWYTSFHRRPQFACHLTPGHLWIEGMWALNNSNYHGGVCPTVIFLFRHSFYNSCLEFYCNKELFFNSTSLFIQSFICISMESGIYGITTIFYFVAQLTPRLAIERLLTLALLSFRHLLKINKKMRKTTMSPVILDWNWRYQYELMIFNIYTDRWMQTKI